MKDKKKGLIKVSDTTLLKKDLTKINLIGDPGCDGLGAGIMSIFARALTADTADTLLKLINIQTNVLCVVPPRIRSCLFCKAIHVVVY
jgi:hypothetical protein